MEIEKQLKLEQENNEMLNKKQAILEDQIYSKELEIESLNSKYGIMIESRDTQIRSLQVELERARSQFRSYEGFVDDNEHSLEMDFENKRLQDEIKQMKEEISYWKSLRGEQNNSNELTVATDNECAANKKGPVEIEIQLDDQYCNNKEGHFQSNLSIPQKVDITLDGNQEHLLNTCHRLQKENETLAEQKKDLQNAYYRLQNENEIYLKELQTAKLHFNEILAEMQQYKGNDEMNERELLETKKQLNEAIAEVERCKTLFESFGETGFVCLNSRQDIPSANETKASELHTNYEMEMPMEFGQATYQLGETEKDRQLEKLRRENNELASAYNDLNEEFERHKAEHGSVVVSNRDLTNRIDALRANLIEYEERYELCKAENAETVQQLEKLSIDFDRLRASFEASKGSSIANATDEVEKLRIELDASKIDRERLRADVEKFRSAIGSIDEELNKLRESNERLARDNRAMGESLDKFNEIRDMLERSDNQLKILRDKFVQLQLEHARKEEEWRSQIEFLSESRDENKNQVKESTTAVDEFIPTHCRSSVEIQTDSELCLNGENTLSNFYEPEKKFNEGYGQTNFNGFNEDLVLFRQVMDKGLDQNAQMISETGVISVEKYEKLQNQNQELENSLHAHLRYIDQLTSQLNTLQNEHKFCVKTVDELRETNSELLTFNQQLNSDLTSVMQQLQSFEAINQKQSINTSEFNNLSVRVEKLQKELETISRDKEKALRECERLREHLVTVEDTSTKEAVMAEEREVALRAKIKELELQIHESADSAISSTSVLQENLIKLSDQLEATKAEKQLLMKRLEETTTSFSDNQIALSNLQKVFQDIRLEYDLEVAQYEKDIVDVKNVVEEQKRQMILAQDKEKAIIGEKLILEDTIAHLNETISKKDAIIEELETQLSERIAVYSTNSVSQIDHEILKQLFLSYFTAQPNKKPEIAMLLASILGYKEEDLTKIEIANGLRNSKLSRTNSSSRYAANKISLAEQFIRFLENESVTSATSHSLPIEVLKEKTTLRSSSVPLAPVEPADAEELRSILDT